jgi:hypothetical protein
MPVQPVTEEEGRDVGREGEIDGKELALQEAELLRVRDDGYDSQDR